MAKPKSKKTITKPAAVQDDVPAPVEDQAKLTKKKGRPAKIKPAPLEISGDLSMSSGEEDTPEVGGADSGEEVEVTPSAENKENSKPGPGSRSKQNKSDQHSFRSRKHIHHPLLADAGYKR